MFGEGGDKGKYLQVVGGGDDKGKCLQVGGRIVNNASGVTGGTIEVVGGGEDKSKYSLVVGIDELHSTTTNATTTVNQQNINVAIVDSGDSHHCTPINIPCSNKRPCVTPYSVSIPDSSVIHATHTAELDLPWLPLSARKVYLFPDFT